MDHVPMALLVIAYPQLTALVYDDIQAVRARHDPQYTLVAPHITLVFPTTTISPPELITHVARQARLHTPIVFTMRCASSVKDPLSPLTHVFLVPDQGFSQIVRLHDALYTDLLAPALRLDLPFIPHITIGAYPDPTISKALADQINQRDVVIEGQITTLDIIQNTPPIVPSLACIQLG